MSRSQSVKIFFHFGFHMIIFYEIYHLYIGRYGSVVIAIRYAMDGLGIYYLWRRDFPPLSSPGFLHNVYLSFPGEKGPVRDVDYPCPYIATLENEERYTTNPRLSFYVLL